jgi:high-affinity iron transporter
MSDLFNFAALTIFARECLEGSIIIGEYRTIISRGESLAPGVSKDDALSEVTLAGILASIGAIILIAAVAIPLGYLSVNFDASTAYIIEGISKIVAAISLLQLSLELPKFLGVYCSSKKRNVRNEDVHAVDNGGMTIRYIRFNVAWNIWREVAECGVFLIPIFLTGDKLKSIPLSALVGSIVGILCGYGIYVANRKLTKKTSLAVFSVLLLVILSAGLFTGGCHRLELETKPTKLVWELDGDFWSVHRLPMTLIKPFGYNDSRSVLEIVCYWSWLALSAALHFRKYKISQILKQNDSRTDVSSEIISSPEDGVDTEMGGAPEKVCRLQTDSSRSPASSSEASEEENTEQQTSAS